jgi:hypothetical protein
MGDRKGPENATYIAPANACILHIDEDVMRILELGNRPVLEFDFMDAF